MRTARALFASVGTSVLLVAAATLSLLSASAVFALGGFEGAEEAGASEAVVLELSARPRPDAGRESTTTAIVLRTPTPPVRPRATRTSPRRPQAHTKSQASTTSPSTDAQVAKPAEATPPASGPQPQPPVIAKPAAPKNLGDGVRDLGDNLSATVQQTGDALAQATAPLGPPISAAVQEALNLVAALLQATTDGLATGLGAQP